MRMTLLKSLIVACALEMFGVGGVNRKKEGVVICGSVWLVPSLLSGLEAEVLK